MIYLLTTSISSSDAATTGETIVQDVENSLQNSRFFSWSDFVSYLQDSMPTVLNFLVKLVIAIIVIIIGRFLIRLARRLIRRFLVKVGLEEGVVQFLDKVINVALWFLLILLVLDAFGITASSVIAIIGSIGLSIGLALQGSLANFAGGVLIMIIHPFRVGDYIRDSNGNEGKVTEILLFYTKLLTLDNKMVIIPNGELSNASLTNFSQEDKRRVDLKVQISYHADLVKAKNVLTETAEKEELRLPDEPVQVFVDELQDSGVEMEVRIWVKTMDYMKAKWSLTENVKLALDENGIEIPFPQVTVSYEE